MTLLIVDDHEIVRKGLLASFAVEECFEKIEEASNIEDAMKVLRISRPDITLLDINLAGKENGLDLITKAKKENIVTKFVVLTSSSRKGDFVKAKELEVEGYILKDSNVEDIIYGLKCIGRGRKFYDAGVETQVKKGQNSHLQEVLTEREYEVLIELGKGYTNTQIAEKLFITENTVKKHISSLLGKLGMTHRTEAALFAARQWRRKEDLGVK
ncbi:response regulator [Cellulosilyticum sp. I15G10I2]|uniref:response regulator n=1 Tax=Cellulosilyticum sp. I15G10I2 TaxID=1892843 RepID=UPI00085BD05D|nr:response regulator transcription factor [Cellulosilyticum sp. I15G10I2]